MEPLDVRLSKLGVEDLRRWCSVLGRVAASKISPEDLREQVTLYYNQPEVCTHRACANVEYNAMRSELKLLGVPAKGPKAELIDRLVAARQTAAQAKSVDDAKVLGSQSSLSNPEVEGGNAGSDSAKEKESEEDTSSSQESTPVELDEDKEVSPESFAGHGFRYDDPLQLRSFYRRVLNTVENSTVRFRLFEFQPPSISLNGVDDVTEPLEIAEALQNLIPGFNLQEAIGEKPNVEAFLQQSGSHGNELLQGSLGVMGMVKVGLTFVSQLPGAKDFNLSCDDLLDSNSNSRVWELAVLCFYLLGIVPGGTIKGLQAAFQESVALEERAKDLLAVAYLGQSSTAQERIEEMTVATGALLTRKELDDCLSAIGLVSHT